MELSQFLQEPFLILVPVLVSIGWFIKSTTLIRDEFIPLTLGIVGVLISVLWKGIDIKVVMQGIIAAALSVYGNQNLKQLQKME